MFGLAKNVLRAPAEVAATGAAEAVALTAEAAAEVATGAAVVTAGTAIGAATVASRGAVGVASGAAIVATGAATLVGEAAAALANTIVVDGFRIPSFYDQEVFRDARRYKPERGRIVVVANPKCGSTWISQIVSLIQRKGVAAATAEEFFSLVQLLEVTPMSHLRGHSMEGCIRTHLPFDQATFSTDAKYIYVARHPANCVVEFYNHMVNFPLALFEGAFDLFFDLFLGGGIGLVDYFDHLLSWYERRNDPNVLFISYESLKYDLRGTVLQVARFMGEEHYNMLLEGGEFILRNVLQFSSLDFMTQSIGKFYEDIFYNPPSSAMQAQFPFLRTFAQGVQAILGGRMAFGGIQRRRGVEITLTVAQREKLDRRIQERCGNSQVMLLWNKPRIIDAGGVRIPRCYDIGTFHEARRYLPDKGRVVVAAYPNCGDTWISQIVSLILRGGKPPASAVEYFRYVRHLEVTPLSLLQGLPKEGCILTHLPFEQINFSRDAKYIYIMKNPADVVVDFYNHLCSFPGSHFEGTFDDFFELFFRGEVEFGDYFDHLLSWYERRNDPNVLFLTYESLQADLRSAILQVATFMGEEFLNLLMAGGEIVLKQVLEFSSLNFLRQTVDKFYEAAFGGLPSADLQAEFPFLTSYALGLLEACEEGTTLVKSYNKQGITGISLTAGQRQRLDSRTRARFGSAYETWSTSVTTSSTTIVSSGRVEGGHSGSHSTTVVRTIGGETDSQSSTYTTTTTTKKVMIVRET